MVVKKSASFVCSIERERRGRVVVNYANGTRGYILNHESELHMLQMCALRWGNGSYT